MLIGGHFMYKNPPKKINSVIGYRSKMSRKNKDTWIFAHKYCGKLWVKMGAIMLLLSIIVQIPFVHASDDAIGNMTLIIETVQLILLLGSIVIVEKALKNTFDKYGNPRNI